MKKLVTDIIDKELCKMIDLAKSKLMDWKINDYVDVGGVSACIKTEKSNYYIGVCYDTSASLGMCAERNAIAQMLVNKENEIEKIVCIDSDNNFLSPCGVCRELIKQLDPKYNGNAEILLSVNPLKIVTINELLPDWWGDARQKQKK